MGEINDIAKHNWIMNKKVMGMAGYFGKSVLILSLTQSLSKTVYDCGTNHYCHVYIRDKSILEKYDRRYYKVNNDQSLRVLNADKDTNLIGKTILLRSPTKCCLGNGEICHVCYGKNASLALDIADGAPGFGSQEITKVINQMILSAKHLLSTISENVVFNDRFYDFFNLVADEVITSTANSPVDDINEWAIYIDMNDIELHDDMDDATSYNTSIPSGRFYVRNLKTSESYLIESVSEKELFLTDDVIQMVKKNNGLIKFKDIEDGQCIFNIDIMNNELTKPLYDIMNLLNRKRDREYTIDSMVEYFCDLLVQSGIAAHSLQAEIIIRCLVRRGDNKMFYPDFSHVKEPKYVILTIEQAIESYPSPLLGLTYQDLKEQILADETFFEKSSDAYIDELFKKHVKYDWSN